MFYVTKNGVRALGIGVRPPAVPEANWFPHNSACAWTAAWFTVRGRRFLGEPEIRHTGEWAEQLRWYDSRGLKRSGHRPDLIGWTPSDFVFAVEVELAQKSRARLDAILSLHDNWISHRKIEGVMYIVGDEAGARRIRLGMKRKLYLTEGRARIELIDTIKQETIEAFQAKRSKPALLVPDVPTRPPGGHRSSAR